MNQTRTDAPGPTKPTERVLAPDLARGVMLLLISIANTPIYLLGRELSESGFHPDDGSAIDKITQGLIITTVDMRVYPMFAFLFGYGMVQLFLRQRNAGASESDARRVLRRRNWWLLGFGLVHAALLFVGDILGAYGLAGLVLAWLFLRRTGRTQLVWAGIGTFALGFAAVFSSVGAYLMATRDIPMENTSFGDYIVLLSYNVENPDYVAGAVERISLWPVVVLTSGLLTLSVPIAMLIAFWAANRRILEEAGKHLRLLRTTAVVGITVGWLGGLPHALSHTGVWNVPENALWAFASTQPFTGLLCGLGYVAVFGLIGHHLRQRSAHHGVVTTAVTAVGKRSLSCYLAQSVISAPLLAAWGLGLGVYLHSASLLAFAVGVWALTVVLAYLMERAGRRGPAEVLLRRLSYGRPHART
ncbi:DUF418 domain-containing protein [Spiractinospora alimapuensis]|uniref:DUF418 domain-containing protein n=1 Tax=Spiractinospora alimapuensis TaxID=2820884 RepID=UPI001F32575B|nr:DUF418 domain-containing protein [Spiractinospora alimapuensis]QVQ51839.1 DUF418 domain-containing protein [Spiractinospora alimapuensis]